MKVIIIMLFFVSFYGFGQKDVTKRKSIYFELAGSGGLGSFNYENPFYQEISTIYFSIRI